jgi:hypothetical protein
MNLLLKANVLTSVRGEGTLYTGMEGPFSVALALAKEGYYPKEITSDNFIFRRQPLGVNR